VERTFAVRFGDFIGKAGIIILIDWLDVIWAMVGARKGESSSVVEEVVA
jgi:hypothetical protein